MMTRFALLLTTTALMACAAPIAPVAPASPGASSPVAATASAGTPTLTRSLPPPRYPSPTASSIATATQAPPAAEGTITLTGVVFSDGRLELYGAHVSVQSLDPKAPFSARVTAPKGVYTVEGVPAGTQIRVTASLPGYEVRTQMYTTGSGTGGDKVDFDGPYALPKTS